MAKRNAAKILQNFSISVTKSSDHCGVFSSAGPAFFTTKGTVMNTLEIVMTSKDHNEITAAAKDAARECGLEDDHSILAFALGYLSAALESKNRDLDPWYTTQDRDKNFTGVRDA